MMKGSAGVNGARVLRAGAIYFAIVFGVGFVLGFIRVLWVVPRLGVRAAELLEAPLMLAAIVLGARYIVRRYTTGTATSIGTGFVALALLLVAETSVGLILQGESLTQVFLDRDPIAGAVYYSMLCLFALMPWLIARRRESEISASN